MIVCKICGKNHATFEHRIYEKLKLAASGVPIETLFIMSNENTGNTVIDDKLNKIREVLE